MINQLSKFRLYKSIKSNFKTKNYLEMNISKSLRSIFAQLRSGCGMLPIRIETGLFKRDPLDARWAGSFIIHYVSYICNFFNNLSHYRLLTYLLYIPAYEHSNILRNLAYYKIRSASLK